MPKLSSRLSRISESATLKLNATVQAMKASGADLVNLTAGEPDFFVHDEGKKAAVAAVNSNRSKYTPVAGIPELREAVAKKTNAQQPQLPKPWKASNVVVTNGGKQSLFNIFMATLNEGDEVLIPSPYWLSYPEMVMLAGGTPRFIQTSAEEGFRMSAAKLKSALDQGRPRALILNSPSNPTGGTYSEEEFAEIGKMIASHPNAREMWIISDEIYDRITFGAPKFCSFLKAAPQLQGQTVTVNGMSKSAAMTGWRVGWSVATDSLTSALTKLQGQSTSGINAPAQWASVAVLNLPEEGFSEQVSTYRRRRDLALEILKKAGKLKIVPPQGAFYIFLGISAYLNNGEDSIGFAERVLEKAKVAVVPGTPFGEPGFVRISFATDDVTLREGCERLVRYLNG